MKGPLHSRMVAVRVEMLERRTLLAASLQSSVNVLVSGSETVIDRPVMFTAVVGTQDRTSQMPTGTMTFYDDADADGTPDIALGTVGVVDGIAQFTTTSLRAGFHYVTASYSGDDTFIAATSDAASHHVIYPQVIDILVVYTDSAQRQAEEYDIDIENWIYAAIAEVNEAFINSQIPASAELVYATKIDYVETGSMSTDLQHLAHPVDGHMDSVLGLRNKYGADVVALWEGPEADLGGLGYVMGSLSDRWNAAYGLMTVRQDNSTEPIYAFAHEMGHLLGAGHDHATAASEDGGGGGLFSDSYGYRFTVNGEPYHDLMAYDDPNLPDEVVQTTIPYYSNPNVSYEGVRTGVAGYADAARAINAAVPVVTKYRSTKVPSSTPTVLKLSASSSVFDVSQPVVLTAKISKRAASQQTPKGTVTFYDGATILGTEDVVGSRTTWTGMLSATGGHNLRAVYVADDFFGGSVSAVKKASAYQVALEDDGTLMVTGSDRADRVTLALSNGTVLLRIAGRSYTYDPASVHGLLISGNEGNDLLRVGVGIGPATLYGGAGNDALYGGTADDQLYGEDGNDRLFGGGGNDLLAGGLGLNRLAGDDGDDTLVAFNSSADQLKGGNGADIAWFDSVLDIKRDVIETLRPDELPVA